MKPVILEIEERAQTLTSKWYRKSWSEGAHYVYDKLIKDKQRWKELRNTLKKFVDEDKLEACVREIGKTF